MIPNNALSSPALPGTYAGRPADSISGGLLSYSRGGVAIQDPSLGLDFQVWEGRIVGNWVQVSAPNRPPVTFYQGVDLSYVSLAFDRQMQPVIAMVDDGIARLSWYDSVTASRIITQVGAAEILTPLVYYDDIRALQGNTSDVIISYLKNGSLYFRQQRDRYEIEYELKPGAYYRLNKMGMNKGLRLQFELLFSDYKIKDYL